ncbi:hypothetical protein [Scytonema hofmannii]|nr:hypothetical protein [Scytonema hofmannii]
MANIEISNLLPAGSELFQDSESFLNEMTEREIEDIKGGLLGGLLGGIGLGIPTLDILTGLLGGVIPATAPAPVEPAPVEPPV